MIEAGRIGLGCMGFAGVYGEVDEDEVARAVHRALDLGITMFDTADAYGSGRSEEMLGRILRTRRSEAFIATKFGNIDHEGDRPNAAAYEGRWETCGRPDYVHLACDRSLQRLGVDVIDLYYLHRVDVRVPIEDTVGAMAELVAQGKVRAIGLSEAGPATIRRAHAVDPIAALQSEYSLWTRDCEADVLPLCRELGIAYVAYSPLGRGFLTARVSEAATLSAQDWRRHQPRFSPENYRRNAALLDVVRQVAERHAATPGQVALAWVLSRGRDVFVIPGSKSVRHVEENAGAAGIALSADDMTQLEAAFPPGVAAGDRYPETQMKRLGL